MKKILLGLGFAAAVLTTGAASAQDATQAPAAKSDELRIMGVRVGNPIKPSTWWEASHDKSGAPVAINFMDPEFYVNFINPKEHGKLHTALTNPATWAQFMKVKTYANMMDIAALGKWIDVKTYAPLADPQTYAYWMQPGAYAHDVDLAHYTNMFKPESYGSIVDAALSNFGYSFKTPSNLLSVDEWANSVSAAKTDS